MCITECIPRVVLILLHVVLPFAAIVQPSNKSGSCSQSFSEENPRLLVIQVFYMFHVSVIEFSKGYFTFYILQISEITSTFKANKLAVS